MEVRHERATGSWAWRLSSKYLDDWFPGDVRAAVAHAREQYPGCRIAKVEAKTWGDWILGLQDWAEGPTRYY